MESWCLRSTWTFADPICPNSAIGRNSARRVMSAFLSYLVVREGLRLPQSVRNQYRPDMESWSRSLSSILCQYLAWYAACEVVAAEPPPHKVGEFVQLRWEMSAQLIVVEPQVGQGVEVAQSTWYSPG